MTCLGDTPIGASRQAESVNSPGPMRLACEEIRIRMDEFASAQRGIRRTEFLIERTDQILAQLATLNLRGFPRVPPALRARLIRLVDDLPFEFVKLIRPRPTPTALIDLVFDIQQELFATIRGEPFAGDSLEVA